MILCKLHLHRTSLCVCIISTASSHALYNQKSSRYQLWHEGVNFTPRDHILSTLHLNANYGRTMAKAISGVRMVSFDKILDRLRRQADGCRGAYRIYVAGRRRDNGQVKRSLSSVNIDRWAVNRHAVLQYD